MKKISTLICICFLNVCIALSQTCENCGIGKDNPTSKLHIKGCTMASGTSSLNVTDSNNTSILYVRDDGRIGVGMTSSLDEKFNLSGNFKFDYGTNRNIEWYSSNYGSGFGHKIYNFDPSGRTDLRIARRHNSGTWTDQITFTTNGFVGIETSTPSYLLSFGGNANRAFGMERHTTANTAGNYLSIIAGGASSGASDKNGGDLYLQSGIATGTGGSNIYIRTATPQGSSSTSDNTPSTKMTILGNGSIGMGTTSPSSLLHLYSSGSTIMKFGRTGASLFGLEISGTTFGLYNHTDAKYIWKANSGDLYLQESGGRIGIGTTAPSSLAHVSSGTSGDAEFTIDADTDNNNENDNPYITFKQDAGQISSFIGLEGDAGARSTGTIANAFVLGSEGGIPIQFATTDAVRMTIATDGNVGIGTTSQAGLLHIAGTDYKNLYLQRSSADAGSPGMLSRKSRGTVASPANISSGDALFQIRMEPYHNSGWRDLGSHMDILAAGSGSGNNLPTKIQFNTATSLGGTSMRMTIDSSGYIGIGTASPQGKLDVESGASATDALFVKASSGVVDQGGIIHHQGSTYAWQEVAQSTGGVTGQLKFHYVSRTSPGSKTASNVMTLRTNGSNSYVGIGQGTPTWQLQLTTDSAAKLSTSTWFTLSDQRLKKDIVPFSDGLSKIRQINPVQYKYNGVAGTEANGQHIGIVAQQMQTIAPYTVGNGKYILSGEIGDKFPYEKKLIGTEEVKEANGNVKNVNIYEVDILTFNAHALFFMLINAVKELDTKNSDLLTELETLKTRIQALENKQ